ncbi:hypothetical protein Tco_0209856 [Tanacetum coccineum]
MLWDSSSLRGIHWQYIVFIYVELQCHELRKTNALGYSTFRCYPDLGVLQIGIRAKVIENQAQRIHRHCQLFKKRDEREPMFLHAHDPDYVPEPIYPEYIPWADPEEDPEEYEDDEIEDGPVDYPMDGGDDRDDDDDDSSGDDADGEDEDDEGRREKEEALAPADSAIVLYLNYVRPQASIIPSTRGIDPAEEVPEIAPMTMGEVNNRVTELAELHEQDTQFRGVCVSLLRAIRAQSSPFILLARQSKQSQPFVFEKRVERKWREGVFGLNWVKRVRVRPTRGRGIDYGFVSTVDAEERRQGIRDVGYGIRDTWVDLAEAVPEIAPMTVGEVNTRVTELVELHEHDTQDLYALLEDAQDRDNMNGGGGGLCFPIGLGSLDRIESGDSSGASDPS